VFALFCRFAFSRVEQGASQNEPINQSNCCASILHGRRLTRTANSRIFTVRTFPTASTVVLRAFGNAPLYSVHFVVERRVGRNSCGVFPWVRIRQSFRVRFMGIRNASDTIDSFSQKLEYNVIPPLRLLSHMDYSKDPWAKSDAFVSRAISTVCSTGLPLFLPTWYNYFTGMTIDHAQGAL
jgi:hypothetical protein